MYYFPSTWKRLLARFIDSGVIFILQLPVIYLFFIDFLRTEEVKIHWAHVVYFFAVRISYETFSVAFFSATIGKKQMGLTVISRNNFVGDKQVHLDQAFLRSLVSQLSLIFGWSLFVTAFLKYNRTHIADWVADTQVLSKTPQSVRPKIRWVLAFGFIFIFLSSSVKNTVMTLDYLEWKNPYLYVQKNYVKKLINQFNLDIEVSEDF
ncbi:MAG: RDD family protein [Deltaproteobacteria bacterium]|nr:RDD family protein [Deltaproteobacteria bacterium]